MATTTTTTTKQTKSQTLQSPHTDYIHAIAFDHYGRRIATCSGDRTVKIWDLDDDGEWISTTSPSSSATTANTNTNNSTGDGSGSEWTAHLGGVTGVSWAHPEFGQLLATCGSDSFCTIWCEETVSTTTTTTDPSGGGGGVVPNNNTVAATRWTQRAQLVADNHKSLTCVKFAPRHLRLKLATASVDGLVRIYEAVDVMNLTQWVLKNTIDVSEREGNADHHHHHHHHNMDHHHGGGGGGGTGTGGGGGGGNHPNWDLGVTCLDWCTGRFEPPTLVVGGSSGNVSVYRYSDASENWGLYLRLDGHSDPRHGVLDVAWSPNVGRSFHLIASCGRDGVLRVHRLKRLTSYEGENQGQEGANLKTGLQLECSQVLDTEGAEVWRCGWNVTGTVLASSGDGGVVQLWKADFRGMWKCVARLNGSGGD